MSFRFSNRRLLLRFMLVIIAVAVGWGRAAAASEITAPVEQLHAGLMSIMKAGKTASFRQRYETIAPVVGQTFDLEVILRQVVGPRWASLPARPTGGACGCFPPLHDCLLCRQFRQLFGAALRY